MDEARGTTQRLRVIFVAGLDPVRSGGTGGQLVEARTVFESPLKEHVTLIPISSTMDSVPPPPLLIRAAGAARRLGRFLCLAPAADVVFVYAGSGLSLVEKGMMCMLARALGKGVVVRFGSGELPTFIKRSWWLERWLRLVLHGSHVIATQGPRWSRFFASFPEGQGKIMEIMNPVSIPTLSAPFAKNGRTVVFAGWMHREKGIFEGLETFRRVLRKVPDAQFILAGGGRDLEEFRAAVRSLGLDNRVETPGWLEHCEVGRLFEKADIFFFPSHYEGLPNALLEAMSAALPSVATRVGAVPDVLVDQVSGILVDVGDVEAMTSALTRLLSDPKTGRAMGAAARLTILERFTVDAVWPGYLDAFVTAAKMARGR